MSSLGRSDAFSVVGGMPAARFIEGKISRVAGSQAFVIAPGFDAGLEFGPVVYSGPTPVVGAFCVVAVMTGTTRAYLVQHDAANAGSPTLDTWHAFPFNANFSNYGSIFQVCEFTKDIFGFVHLRGLYHKLTVAPASGEVVGILPVGYRPAALEIFTQPSSASVNWFDRIDIDASGNVAWSSTDRAWDGGYASLAGISFQAATPPTTIFAGPAGPPGPPGAGTPYYGASPPASPTNGQEWIYPADAAGTLWRFRYNSASVSAYKWEFVGGSPLDSYIDAHQATASTTYADLGGPAVTAPLAGDYMTEFDARIYGDSAGQSARVGLHVNGALWITLDWYTSGPGTGSPSVGGHNARTTRYNGATLGTIFKLFYATNTGTITSGYRHVSITPVRVG